MALRPSRDDDNLRRQALQGLLSVSKEGDSGNEASRVGETFGILIAETDGNKGLREGLHPPPERGGLAPLRIKLVEKSGVPASDQEGPSTHPLPLRAA